MSSNYSKKLREIRKAEGLTQAALAAETGVALSSIRNYESGVREVGLTVVDKVLSSARFEKYTLWLMTDKTAPEAGQIAPALSPSGQEDTTSPHSSQKTG